MQNPRRVRCVALYLTFSVGGARGEPGSCFSRAMVDEKTRLLDVSAKMEHSNSAAMRARAGTFLIIFIGSIFFILDCGLPISSASGQASHSVSKKADASHMVSPPPPCCHSGSQEGRRATEAIRDGDLASQCILCPSSSSGAGSSSSTDIAHEPAAAAAPAFAVRPCRDGMYELLTSARGQLGPRPPQWPVPTETGLWYTSHYVSCPKTAARTGDCWWRTKKAGMNALKHPAGIECVRKEKAYREGETATESRHRNHKAHGVTPTEARHLNHEARGVTPNEARIQNYKAAGRTRADNEIAYSLKHGFPRASRGDGFGNLAHAFTMLQQQHIHNAMWPYELTGSTGTVEDLHVQLRSPIVHTLYDWMQPSPSALTSGSHSLQVLLRHMGQRGLFMVVDCEFVSPQRLRQRACRSRRKAGRVDGGIGGSIGGGVSISGGSATDGGMGGSVGGGGGGVRGAYPVGTVIGAMGATVGSGIVSGSGSIGSVGGIGGGSSDGDIGFYIAYNPNPRHRHNHHHR